MCRILPMPGVRADVQEPGDGRAANVKHVQKGILRILDDHRAADILDRMKRQG